MNSSPPLHLLLSALIPLPKVELEIQIHAPTSSSMSESSTPNSTYEQSTPRLRDSTHLEAQQLRLSDKLNLAVTVTSYHGRFPPTRLEVNGC